MGKNTVSITDVQKLTMKVFNTIVCSKSVEDIQEILDSENVISNNKINILKYPKIKFNISNLIIRWKFVI